MFIFRWIKNLISLGFFLAALYIGSGFVNYHGRPLRDQAKTFFASDAWKEGVKDMRTWAAALLRLASTKIEEGISADDAQKLNQVIQNDMKTTGVALPTPAAPRMAPAAGATQNLAAPTTAGAPHP